jgi:hypothetical protein
VNEPTSLSEKAQNSGRNDPESVAALLWNQWPRSIGINGRHRLESVAGIGRNQWPESVGIGGRNGPEYASSEEENPPNLKFV